MKLRRRFLVEARYNKTIQKCLAVTIMLKVRLKTSRIHHYSINRLCQVVGISHKTAEKYEKKMLEYGFIHFEGTQDNRVLIVNSISSHTSNRNISIDEMDFSNVFAAYRSLQSFLFMRVQHNKDFLRHLLQARHNPESSKEYRVAMKQVKDLVKQGVLRSVNTKYKEKGLSLERIAKEVGCCARTAERIIKFAVGRHWIERQKNFEWIHAPHINHRQIDGFTFSTKHKLCIVHPNTYLLSPAISRSLSYQHGII